MNKKFVVRLSVEERGLLETLVAKGRLRVSHRDLEFERSRPGRPWPGASDAVHSGLGQRVPQCLQC